MVARFIWLSAVIVAAIPSAAQNYRFEIPKYVCNVSLGEDATLAIYYEITFHCMPGADPIDIVDIGFPTSEYDISSVAAEIDGTPLTTIRPSEYIPVGVEIPLGDAAVMPGETSVLRVSGNNPGMAFRDSSDPSCASTEFAPTWFDPSCVQGESNCVISFAFPPGADSASVRYHGTPFTGAWISDDGRVVYEWRMEAAISSAIGIGVSYPASLLSVEVSDAPRQSYGSGGGIHRSLIESACPVLCGAAFPLAFALLLAFTIINANRRKLDYLPPKLGVEGTGIKRGLTAPMAAMLLELKLDKVSALILYGLVLKGAVDLESDGTVPGARPVMRRRTPAPEGLHDYEKGFLEALSDGPGGAVKVDADGLQKVFVAMVKDLKEKMAGFSARETREYYRSIISAAWKTASEAGTPETVGAVLGEQLQWMMMDKDFDERVGRLPSAAYIPIGSLGSHGTGRLVTGQGNVSIVQACSRIAGTLESAAGGMVSSFSSIASGVTSVTNPIPVRTGYGGRSGGGSCACACACAGCACACAGGGR
ncbi:MAG TPA: hypothetical protein P5266_03515 [Candidatus Fermentibacter sp.]|nr:hypothetical protein [Candidatus Fermentibacter sp.]